MLHNKLLFRVGKENGNCGSTLFIRDNSTVISIRAFDSKWQEISVSLQASVKRSNANKKDPNKETYDTTSRL